jgi:hypothetical protein
LRERRGRRRVGPGITPTWDATAPTCGDRPSPGALVKPGVPSRVDLAIGHYERLVEPKDARASSPSVRTRGPCPTDGRRSQSPRSDASSHRQRWAEVAPVMLAQHCASFPFGGPAPHPSPIRLARAYSRHWLLTGQSTQIQRAASTPPPWLGEDRGCEVGAVAVCHPLSARVRGSSEPEVVLASGRHRRGARWAR